MSWRDRVTRNKILIFGGKPKRRSQMLESVPQPKDKSALSVTDLCRRFNQRVEHWLEFARLTGR